MPAAQADVALALAQVAVALVGVVSADSSADFLADAATATAKALEEDEDMELVEAGDVVSADSSAYVAQDVALALAQVAVALVGVVSADSSADAATAKALEDTAQDTVVEAAGAASAASSEAPAVDVIPAEAADEVLVDMEMASETSLVEGAMMLVATTTSIDPASSPEPLRNSRRDGMQPETRTRTPNPTIPNPTKTPTTPNKNRLGKRPTHQPHPKEQPK